MKKKYWYLSIISVITMIFTVVSFLYVKKIESYKHNELNYSSQNYFSYKLIEVSDIIDKSIEDNYNTYLFYSEMFGIDFDTMVNKIKETNYNNFNELDIENIGVCSKSIDEALIKFLTNLEKADKKLFNRKYTYKQVSKDYVYGLVEYFVSIYDNVDLQTAKSIAWIESGNLNSKFMMKKNNIFGGMGSNGLVEYPSIEYGVYKYIKLLSVNYYGKGLNTVEKIGRVYNPVVIDGIKQASPTWVVNVTKYRSKFKSEITINSIDLLKEL